MLLLRSELIRAPGRRRHRVHPGANPPQPLLPVFRGSLGPDVSYFGFSIPLAQADQYAISIAEQPSAPRFGFEVGEAPPGVTHARPPTRPRRPSPDGCANSRPGSPFRSPC